VQAAQDTSFRALIEKLNAFMRIIEKDPAVENVVSFTGAGAAAGARENGASPHTPRPRRRTSSQPAVACWRACS
jgi:multidrug efflux pump subunit AcrB